MQFCMISLIVHGRNFESNFSALSLRISIEAYAKTRVDWTKLGFSPSQGFPSPQRRLGWRSYCKIGDILEVSSDFAISEMRGSMITSLSSSKHFKMILRSLALPYASTTRRVRFCRSIHLSPNWTEKTSLQQGMPRSRRFYEARRCRWRLRKKKVACIVYL